MPGTTSKVAPIDFTGVEPIQLESFAYLNPGWYRFRIDDAKYTGETVSSDGKTQSPYISWAMIVLKAYDPEDADYAEHVLGKRLRDFFRYGQSRNMGIGRFMAALTAVRDGKLPVAKDGSPLKTALDLSPYDGKEVICRVDDNDYNGKTTTQVKEYYGISEEKRIVTMLSRMPKSSTPAQPVATPPPDMEAESLDDEFE